MEILVCAKRVPDTSENEIQLNGAGTDIERDDLVYSVNEPDNYAVEEALQIVARTGGNVTVVTVGGEEDEEILRREMAMGANRGVLISDDTFHGSDGRGIAATLKAFVQMGHYDLILTGVQAEDGCAQVGGMLAAMLDYPFASLVTSIEVLESRKLKIGREIEGGSKEINAIDLPCVLSIQTGINEPRYVGMRGIRQVASVPIPTLGASDLGVDMDAVGEAAAKARRVDYFVPPAGKGAEMLEGSREEVDRQTDGSAEGQRRAELMPRIFAYIVHKSGVADDTAAELPVAARKIDPAQPCTAIVTGWGADLDQVCESLRASYSEDLEDRQGAAGVSQRRTGPQGAVERVARGQHRAGSARPLRRRSLARAFHQNECSVRAGRAGYRRRRRGVAQSRPPGIRRPGQHAMSAATSSTGAVLNIRPGAFRPSEGAPAGGQVVDQIGGRRRPDGAAPLSGDHRRRDRRCRYHQAGGAGLDRPRHRGAGECRHRRGSGGGHGRGGELLAAGGGCQVDG